MRPADGPRYRIAGLCLLKSPFWLRQLMLRPTMGTLPGDDAGTALAPPDLPNIRSFARRPPARNTGPAAPTGGAAAYPISTGAALEDRSLALGRARAPLDRMANRARHRQA